MAWEAGVGARWLLRLHDGGQDLAEHVVVDQADLPSVVAGGRRVRRCCGVPEKHFKLWPVNVTLVKFVQRLLLRNIFMAKIIFANAS